MHCPLRNFCNCCLKICFLKRKHKGVFSLVWAFASSLWNRHCGAPTQARPLCLSRLSCWSLSSFRWDLQTFCYVFFFSTGVLFYILYRRSILLWSSACKSIYFHKFLSETVFHMVQIKTRWSSDHPTRSAFERTDEMAPKSAFRLICSEIL